MKKLNLLIVLTTLLFAQTKASHFLGGELGWKCLSNGQYVFHMTVLADCSGIPLTYQNETIDIIGSPLPGMSSIIVTPDSNRWLNSNNGDTSPECTSQYGAPYTCASGDFGTVQRFFYKSDTITLTGVPPTGGWEFFWEAPCCRPNDIDNVNTSGALLLRAAMFANASNNAVDTCFDSSPEFTDLPTMIICRGQELTYNHVVVDQDGDSLVYTWGRPYNSPLNNPMALPYKPGYSPTNPTPDTNIDSNNIASVLNPTLGIVNFKIVSGTGGDRFLKVLDVSSWRDGVKISQVSREFLFTVLDCPPLPSGQANAAPEFIMNVTKDSDGIYRDTIVVGTTIDYLINIADTAATGAGNGFQGITMIPFGESFSLDFADSSNCRNLNDSSCAFLNPAPVFNTGATPPQYELAGLYTIGTSFKWQTDCNHLSDNGDSKTHSFTFKYHDDHCPIPASGYQFLEITVLPSSQPCNLLTNINKNALQEFENGVKVYPNPTNGRVFIQMEKATSNSTIQVRNIHGQLVDSYNISNQQTFELTLKGKKGIYFIEILNDKGEKANLKVLKN